LPFIVLVPFSDRVSISQKIEDKKKRQTKKTYNPSNQKDLVLLFAQ
jgi:Ribonuclease G/E